MNQHNAGFIISNTSLHIRTGNCYSKFSPSVSRAVSIFEMDTNIIVSSKAAEHYRDKSVLKSLSHMYCMYPHQDAGCLGHTCPPYTLWHSVGLCTQKSSIVLKRAIQLICCEIRFTEIASHPLT